MLAELLDLLIALFSKRRKATPDEIRRFYKSVEWKRARYETLRRNPRCSICGRGVKDGVVMQVDHIQPLSRRWDLRLAPANLQSACRGCNFGKGGR